MSRFRSSAPRPFLTGKWARATFPYPSPLAWAMLALVIVTDIVWSVLGGYHVASSSVANLSLAALCLAMLSGFCIYGRGRDDLAGVVAWASATLFIIPFSIAGIVLTYLAASLAMPLQDTYFAAVDQTLGFDWVGLLRFVNEHEHFGRLTSTIYNTAFPELALIVLLLGLTKRANELRELIDIYWITLLITIMLSGLLPALAPFMHYKVALADFPVVQPNGGITFIPDYLALRSGTYDTFNFGHMEGLITFPSFHAASAVMMAWSLRHMPVLRLAGIVYSGLMIIGTLTEGGHYLADVVAGSLLVIAAIAIRHALTRHEKQAPDIAPLQALQGFD